ncbi:MAG: proteasome assembly chaperone family protein [Methanomicrobium sp.]|nr:proteasome assembly chaperone family protein [Methanomicrobium sp.]
MDDDIRIISEAPASEDITVFFGFPGSELVGSIAVQFLVDSLKYKYLGGITGRMFPPVAMMVDGVIASPLRIYGKDNCVAVVSEIPIPPEDCYDLTQALLDWFSQYKIKDVTVVAGMVTNSGEKRVFGVGSDDKSIAAIRDLVNVLPMGSISGMAGSILLECRARGIPAIGLLGETVNIPDPRSAVSVLEIVNGTYDFDIPVDRLLAEAENIEESMQRIAEQVSGKEEENEAPKIEHLPMYG